MVRSFKSVPPRNWGSREEIVCAHSTNVCLWVIHGKYRRKISPALLHGPTTFNTGYALSKSVLSLISSILFLPELAVADCTKRKLDGSVLSSTEDRKGEEGRGKEETRKGKGESKLLPTSSVSCMLYDQCVVYKCFGEIHLSTYFQGILALFFSCT